MSAKPKLRRREFWLLLGACVLVLLLAPVLRYYQLRATARAYVATSGAGGEKPFQLPPPSFCLRLSAIMLRFP